ncbi:biotin transport system substrate-specific component [Microlunatus sagamiharensis]|uniref:Biotin transporter n=1 Tax=Microlunatus sagamiharensis TaxID=546874 RepID=A0A1H2NHF2_9ACTN|nr:biotin transporter BioY [Microlunatus sagamiharensis]SDV04853.1 biotin transport system substrate-specific component [Microlunatus sagamiharensis]
MSLVSASPRTLGDVVPGGLVRNVALVVGGTLLVALSALVQIPLPFTPVPLSLQTFAVLVVGASLGSRRGAAAMVLYLAAGMAGVPWFAAHQSGWAFASFGYVVGFVAAGWVAGRLAEAGADRNVVKNVGLLVLGSIIVYAFGVSGLIAATGMDLGTALAKGVVPFLIGDVVKVVVAAALLPAAWKLVGRRG